MLRRASIHPAVRWTALSLALTVAAAPAFAAGFGIFEQGSKAMGMAGAFTAQADDGSAMFHNVAGLAFQKETSYEAGVTLISFFKSELDGRDPFPGVGAEAEQADNIFFPPHLYYVRPINERLTFGFAVNAPFGLTTEWEDPFNFPGRFISVEANLRGIDFNPSIGYQVNDNFGVGFGLVGRMSDVELTRHVPVLNPFNNTVTDGGVANLDSDFDFGFGWNVGLLHKVGRYLSWGLSYRSKIDIDYSGDGVFTQVSTGNPTLDGLVAAQIPFDQNLPIETSIEFPDMASLGVALGLTETVLLEVDVNWTGWSTFDQIVIDFTENQQFSSVIPENYEDAYNYRIGVQIGDDNGPQWRFGVVYDETPQPDAAVGPLLPDADRLGLTIGYGSKHFDLAFMYLDFDERTPSESSDDFLATYDTDAWLLGVTVNF